MVFDIGLPPVATLLIAVLVFAIISDFLLELFSVRLSLSSGKIQTFLFNHIGQNLFMDYLLSILFQFLSFRKKAFYTQIAAFINVGSFSRVQTPLILTGSFVGIGLSLLILNGASLVTGVVLGLASLLLTLFRKEQLKDLGLAFLSLGLFFIAIDFFNQFISSSGFNIHNYHLGELAVPLTVLFSTLFFRTPVPFLIFMAILHQYLHLNLLWLPVIFLFHSLTAQAGFYWNFILGRGRLRLALIWALILQVLQFVVSFLLVFLLQSILRPAFEVSSFWQAFEFQVFFYAGYQALSLILVTPLIFLSTLLPVVSEESKQKNGNQKILVHEGRGQCFSIHLSLLLLRQEFKKYTTAVHTLFKISRESDFEEDKINRRFVKYQGMLNRVGEELKELCFNIGKQRSYRWHVQEIMSYYKCVNQLELLIEDLSFVTSLLRKEDQDEEWERECRFWLGLQLKLFESFFDHTLGVGKEDPEKVQANIDKSYELLDRFFVDSKGKEMNKNISQTFYRITESIGNLAL